MHHACYQNFKYRYTHRKKLFPERSCFRKSLGNLKFNLIFISLHNSTNSTPIKLILCLIDSSHRFLSSSVAIFVRRAVGFCLSWSWSKKPSPPEKELVTAQKISERSPTWRDGLSDQFDTGLKRFRWVLGAILTIAVSSSTTTTTIEWNQLRHQPSSIDREIKRRQLVQYHNQEISMRFETYIDDLSLSMSPYYQFHGKTRFHDEFFLKKLISYEQV